jgi:hypothetical protein
MRETIEQLVRKWSDDHLSRVNLKIVDLEKWLYRTYEPDKFGADDFWVRFGKWLDNVEADSDKKLLMQLLVEILYLGPHEFDELYRCAYEGPIARWLIDTCDIDVFAADAKDKLTEAAKNTWFCPITDSFRINAFFHVNSLAAGANLRPDWHSLRELGSIEKIKKYCENSDRNIKRLVLLEDFVGGGSQSLDTVIFAATQFPDLQVLFVPLVICPKGIENARLLEKEICADRYNPLRYSAVMELPNDAFLTLHQSIDVKTDDDFIKNLRELIKNTYYKVSGGRNPGPKPYDPFGFPSADPTGGMVVMYSNTPDNTLPLIHWSPPEKTWSPIFPRHSRV